MVKKTSLKCIQDAWVHRLFDFKSWFIPESIQTNDWKNRTASQSIRSCRAGIIDDAEAMLTAYRKNPNTAITGDSAYIPIMLIATALVDQPPSVSALMNVPYFNDVLINNKLCKLRMINMSVRTQIAFFATNPDDARSVCQQFCSYMMDDTRRKFNISYELMDGFSDNFGAMVLENELFPAPVPLEQTNLSVFTVDATIVCSVPQVIPADGIGTTTNVDQGYDPNTGIPKTGVINNGVVVQADMYVNDDKKDGITIDPWSYQNNDQLGSNEHDRVTESFDDQNNQTETIETNIKDK